VSDGLSEREGEIDGNEVMDGLLETDGSLEIVGNMEGGIDKVVGFSVVGRLVGGAVGTETHVIPLPVKPVLHAQSTPPILFVQTPFAEQGLAVKHSLISAQAPLAKVYPDSQAHE